MNTTIFTDKASMTSIEIAELVGSRHDSVKRAIERIAERCVTQLPPMVEVENKQSLSPNKYTKAYIFE
ncbi:Rha family transcriptional regulator, partial [Escherichia coli]